MPVGSIRHYVLVCCASAALAGCAAEGAVTPDSAGYKAYAAGAYTTAQKEFEPLQAQNPHEPYLELDLAATYMALGRLDLSEGLNRQAMIDGKNVYPAYTLYPRDAGKSIADIACENIAIGRHTTGC